MEILKSAWDFFQKEILGMRWLDRLIGSFLELCGLDLDSRIGGSIRFFIYDIVKIMALLGVLILIIVYTEFFSAREDKKDTRTLSWDMGKYHCRSAWNGNTVLLLLIDSSVYWIYECGIAAWGYFFISHFFANG